jgi:glycosyltransferase involved in cell wall biosynthesis
MLALDPESRAALIIPALNEELVLGRTLDAIPPALYQIVIVADNGSTDGTAAVARAAGATVVSAPQRGYGAACLKGLAALPAGIDIVVFMQADLSEDPAEARALIAPIARGEADLVLGSRTLGAAEAGALLPHQVFGVWLAILVIRILFSHRYTDLGGFRAIRREALEGLRMRERGYGWTIEMQVRALQTGLRVMEIPVSYRRRAAGVNKISGNLRASLQAGGIIFRTVLRLWWRQWRG